MNHTAERNTHSLLATIILGVSFIIGTTVIGAYIFKSRQPIQTVTVKGLAERDVTANVGTWSIDFRIAGDDLHTLRKKLEKQTKEITAFLTQQGFTSDEVSYGIPDIDDKETLNFKVHRKMRYVAHNAITIRSSKVSALEKTLQKSEELVAKGITLDSSCFWEHRPKFIFTNLNEIKPAMIQEATLAARKAAEQFATDSNSQVGKIQQATQGLFSIEDTHIPTQKHVRVVTTVQYVLVGN